MATSRDGFAGRRECRKGHQQRSACRSARTKGDRLLESLCRSKPCCVWPTTRSVTGTRELRRVAYGIETLMRGRRHGRHVNDHRLNHRFGHRLEFHLERTVGMEGDLNEVVALLSMEWLWQNPRVSESKEANGHFKKRKDGTPRVTSHDASSVMEPGVAHTRASRSSLRFWRGCAVSSLPYRAASTLSKVDRRVQTKQRLVRFRNPVASRCVEHCWMMLVASCALAAPLVWSTATRMLPTRRRQVL